jgi:hypothetical protein
MKNKRRNIIIWLMTWAVLFLVVAYSPIGRPDLYVGNSYYISSSNQGGVNFKNGIANAPKGTTFASTQDNEVETPTYTPDESSSNSYAEDASEYTPQNTANGTYVETNSTKGIATNGTGSTLAYSSSTRSNQAQGTSTAQNDVSSLNSDLTLTSNTNSLQAAPAASSNGGHHPGGHNPKNPPIPVGDGVWVLLLMAGAYFIYKNRHAKITT